MLSRSPRRALVGVLLVLCAVLAAPISGAAAKDRGHDHGDRSGHGRGSGATTLALDPGAAAALESLGVTVAPTGPATASDAGIAFPIVSSPREIFSTGIIRHAGGLSLSAGDVTVTVSRFNIDLSRGVLTAKLNRGARVDLLALDLSTAKPGFADGAFTFGPVGASLTAGAAAALNGAFSVTAFTEGLKLGDATISLRLR